MFSFASIEMDVAVRMTEMSIWGRLYPGTGRNAIVVVAEQRRDARAPRQTIASPLPVSADRKCVQYAMTASLSRRSIADKTSVERTSLLVELSPRKADVPETTQQRTQRRDAGSSTLAMGAVRSP